MIYHAVIWRGSSIFTRLSENKTPWRRAESDGWSRDWLTEDRCVCPLWYLDTSQDRAQAHDWVSAAQGSYRVWRCEYMTSLCCKIHDALFKASYISCYIFRCFCSLLGGNITVELNYSQLWYDGVYLRSLNPAIQLYSHVFIHTRPVLFMRRLVFSQLELISGP